MKLNIEEQKDCSIKGHSYLKYGKKDFMIDFIAGGIGGMALVFISFPME